MSFNFKAILQAVITDAQFVGEESIQVGKDILEFAGLAGPSALPVVTSVLSDIAAGTVTPAQASTQIAQATQFLNTAQAAVAIIKAQDAATTQAPALEAPAAPAAE